MKTMFALVILFSSPTLFASKGRCLNDFGPVVTCNLQPIWTCNQIVEKWLGGSKYKSKYVCGRSANYSSAQSLANLATKSEPGFVRRGNRPPICLHGSINPCDC